MSILIIDYGMSNLGSMQRAVEECGGSVFVSNNPQDIKEASQIILPGVGAFADGMRSLREGGWEEPLVRAVKKKGIPFLGVCLGMHLLADKGYENGESEGLGLIKGEVRLLQTLNSKDKLPHVGWNEIEKVQDSILLCDVPDKSDFYFVHSYHFELRDANDLLARTDYCGGFSSVIGHENIFGVQFHPEKSGKMGFQILKNFLNFYKVQ